MTRTTGERLAFWVCAGFTDKWEQEDAGDAQVPVVSPFQQDVMKFGSAFHADDPRRPLFPPRRLPQRPSGCRGHGRKGMMLDLGTTALIAARGRVVSAVSTCMLEICKMKEMTAHQPDPNPRDSRGELRLQRPARLTFLLERPGQ
jgi:hypothetical protein